MADSEIQEAIDRYLRARHDLIELGEMYPARIGGNDNMIGRIGEFIALRFLECLGQRPLKVLASSNPGFDLQEDCVRTQVKVLTEENNHGRSVRLGEAWDQLLVIELGETYRPRRIGILSKLELQRACSENRGWSATPIVKRTMLGTRGAIRRYGRVYEGDELARLLERKCLERRLEGEQIAIP